MAKFSRGGGVAPEGSGIRKNSAGRTNWISANPAPNRHYHSINRTLTENTYPQIWRPAGNTPAKWLRY
jgi:hypothetical protein